jgi:hypothetical protein
MGFDKQHSLPQLAERRALVRRNRLGIHPKHCSDLCD